MTPGYDARGSCAALTTRNGWSITTITPCRECDPDLHRDALLDREMEEDLDA